MKRDGYRSGLTFNPPPGMPAGPREPEAHSLRLNMLESSSEGLRDRPMGLVPETGVSLIARLPDSLISMRNMLQLSDDLWSQLSGRWSFQLGGSLAMGMLRRALHLDPGRFLQMRSIATDHFVSGISGEQTGKWRIEWNMCAKSRGPVLDRN